MLICWPATILQLDTLCCCFPTDLRPDRLSFLLHCRVKFSFWNGNTRQLFHWIENLKLEFTLCYTIEIVCSKIANFFGQVNIPARQDESYINRKKSWKQCWTCNKWAENRQRTSLICKHVIRKTADGLVYRWRMWYNAWNLGRRNFFAQIPLIWADNFAQYQHSVLPGYSISWLISRLTWFAPLCVLIGQRYWPVTYMLSLIQAVSRKQFCLHWCLFCITLIPNSTERIK